MALQVEQAVRLYRRLLALQMTPTQAKTYVVGMMGLGPKQEGAMRGLLDEMV